MGSVYPAKIPTYMHYYLKLPDVYVAICRDWMLLDIQNKKIDPISLLITLIDMIGACVLCAWGFHIPNF